MIVYKRLSPDDEIDEDDEYILNDSDGAWFVVGEHISGFYSTFRSWFKASGLDADKSFFRRRVEYNPRIRIQKKMPKLMKTNPK